MLSKAEILAGLSRIANEAFALAVVWHLLIALAVVAMLVGWRPSRRTWELLLPLPLLSVSALAWAFGNPFNGLVFALLAGALALHGLRAARTTPIVEPALSATTLVGVGLIAFAWVYPHFLHHRAATVYFYGAPMGLLPCPTLALVAGAMLLTGGTRRRASMLAVAAAALFYGAIGVLRLGVWLDLPLFVGAVTLIAHGVARPTRSVIVKA